MEGNLLLFGFEELEDILRISAAVSPAGIGVRAVGREEYHQRLGVIAGLDPAGQVPTYQGGPLGGRMIVLCGLRQRVEEVLPLLRQAGVGPECLKAVLTDHNRAWTPVQLFGELRAEHHLMQKRR